MTPEVQQLVQALHDAAPQIVLVTAGAGTQALSDLLGVAGASRTLLEALVPYSEASFDEFLGKRPQKYVTSKTSKLLAGRAYTRARWLASGSHPVIGLACTATIVTDRPKRGEHRAFIATWQTERLVQYSLYLEKGRRDRAGEETLISQVMLNALARAFGLEMQLTYTLFEGDRLSSQTSDFAQMVATLFQPELEFFGIMENGKIVTTISTPLAILSGAFNPVHDGHLELARSASELLEHPVAFECAAVNVDKPPLPAETILDRMAQFAGRWPVFASNAPTYVEKARLYPGATFIVGYDTAVRILHPRYYQNSQEKCIAALTEIRDQGCSFLVAGRVGEGGIFRDISHLNVPTDLTPLFHSIPATKFRKDISSTELRTRGLRGSR